MMPPPGSRPDSTSQNVRPVRTPVPRAALHEMSAGAVWRTARGFGFGGGLRVCARRRRQHDAPSTHARARVMTCRHGTPHSDTHDRLGLIESAADGTICRCLISSRNSMRVRALSRKAPSMALVTANEFCFSTPRIDMQRCVALHHDGDAERIDLVADRLGDLVGQPLLHLQPAANTSTRRGILLRPMTCCCGM